MIDFKKQMSQAANIDLFNLLVPKAHRVSVNIYYFLYKLSQWKSAIASLWIFIFSTLASAPMG